MLNLFATLTEGDQKRIAAVILIIAANFVFAIIGALVKGGFDPAKGGFDFNKLPEFFVKQILPYVVGLAFFETYLHLAPPSTSAQLLFGGPPKVIADATSAIPENPWMWLDTTTLWAVYGSMMILLVKKLLANLFYLFGKGIEQAQTIAKK